MNHQFLIHHCEVFLNWPSPDQKRLTEWGQGLHFGVHPIAAWEPGVLGQRKVVVQLEQAMSIGAQKLWEHTQSA